MPVRSSRKYSTKLTKPLSKRKAGSLVTEMISAREQGRELYTRADECFEQLLDHFGLGEHALSDGRVIVISDNFVDSKSGKRKMKVWKPVGVPRYECEVRPAVK